MARKIKLFFATDVHGSEQCFRKFLNAGAAYGPDLMVLGGDVAGKAVQAIVRVDEDRFRFTFRGREHDLPDGDELRHVERLISDNGYYPWRSAPGELEALMADGTVDVLLLDLMRKRLGAWMALADERLRPQDLPAFWMLGNDDPPELEPLLEAAPWGTHVDDRVVDLGDGHALVSLGYANPTPWNTQRELPEEELGARLDALFAHVEDPRRAVLNAHVPPYMSGLDEAPVLDEGLRVQTAAGQVKMGAVGSTAVREAIERHRPMASLHGHVHESAGFRRIGKTLAVNPGSDYGTGALNGALLVLDGEKVRAHQLVRG
jgi:Icc-related predicted phosphoesterase